MLEAFELDLSEAFNHHACRMLLHQEWNDEARGHFDEVDASRVSVVRWRVIRPYVVVGPVLPDVRLDVASLK